MKCRISVKTHLWHIHEPLSPVRLVQVVFSRVSVQHFILMQTCCNSGCIGTYRSISVKFSWGVYQQQIPQSVPKSRLISKLYVLLWFHFDSTNMSSQFCKYWQRSTILSSKQKEKADLVGEPCDGHLCVQGLVVPVHVNIHLLWQLFVSLKL